MDNKEREEGGEFKREIISPDTQKFEEQYGSEIQKHLEEIPEDAFYNEEYYEEEFEENHPKKKKKKRRKKHGFLWFCIVVILIVATVVAANSKLCSIDKITVKGNKNYTAAEIVNMSGVKTGDNLFRTRGGKIAKNLEANSYVQSSDIDRKIPNELIIRVVERDEVACLPYGNKYIVIDNQGYVLNTVSKKPQLTLISNLTVKTMDKGKPLEVKEQDTLKEAISVVKCMQDNDLFFKKIEINKVIVKAYVYDSLLCKGTPKNMKDSMKSGTLEKIIYNLYKKNIKTGTVNISGGKYCTYSPKVE